VYETDIGNRVTAGAPSTVVKVAVPEQVAVPLLRDAEVGADVAPEPNVILEYVTPVQLPGVTKFTLTEAPVSPLLKPLRVHQPAPLIDPPLIVVIEFNPLMV
jgi:hypothetical protein